MDINKEIEKTQENISRSEIDCRRSAGYNQQLSKHLRLLVRTKKFLEDDSKTPESLLKLSRRKAIELFEYLIRIDFETNQNSKLNLFYNEQMEIEKRNTLARIADVKRRLEENPNDGYIEEDPKEYYYYICRRGNDFHINTIRFDFVKNKIDNMKCIQIINIDTASFMLDILNEEV